MTTEKFQMKMIVNSKGHNLIDCFVVLIIQLKQINYLIKQNIQFW